MDTLSFSEILEDFLLLNNLTQTAFAQKIGIKQSQVSEWLKGKAKPGYDMLRRIALEFSIPADYLLDITENCN
jgi:transcriptional regulator with XRE-family HTH domain